MELDIESLMHSSEPRRRVGVLWYAAGAFVLIVLANSLLSARHPELAEVLQGLSMLASLGVLVGLGLLGRALAKRQQMQQMQLQAAEELIALRRWPEAAQTLKAMLSRPAMNPHLRIQAFIFLAAVLARYHRFHDAILLNEWLLEHVSDGPIAHALRLARAMALLREDRLFDADRAISELRRWPESRESGGLALVEMYRDVKTGHPAEALEIFHERLDVLRRQLGARVGDAWALAARAAQMTGQDDLARDAYRKATTLAPASEMVRRYPEIQPLVDSLESASVPAEVA